MLVPGEAGWTTLLEHDGATIGHVEAALASGTLILAN
jgi:hypothetical protein